MLCQTIQEAGVPPGVVNMVFGLGYTAGHALCVHPQVPLVSFTGGTKTGEIITRTAAAFHKKLSLELGGKNPAIIFADCDLADCVATTVRSSFTNQGEVCLCNSRIFVEESIFDTFLAQFVAASRLLVVGDPKASGTTTGPLVSKEHMEKVLSYVQLAKEEGGTFALGGDQPSFPEDSPLSKGYFVNPTIVTGLPPSSRCQQEEIFGPIVTVWPFKTEEEVLGYANGVEYGLSSSVWTKDIKRAHRIALGVQAGTVWVNCWLLVSPLLAMPTCRC
jgi:aminomuconate-semialdehyde/2-hydroxymuconate-6-semialdehyde dehydrogenase